MKAVPLVLLALATCTPAAAPPADPMSGPAAASAAVLTPSTAPSPGSALAPSAASMPASVSWSDPLIGQPAPDFTATAQDGSSVHIAALSGKPVVVYFYPKDETPGCTKEACSFRDAWTALGKTGAVLVGVSADSVDSHKAFALHYKLPFLLVSDPDGSIGKKYGVPFQGHHQRQTIVIGADGKVRKVYRKVDVTMHAQEILADVTTG